MSQDTESPRATTLASEKEAMLAEARQRLDHAVNEGVLTRAEADEKLSSDRHQRTVDGGHQRDGGDPVIRPVHGPRPTRDGKPSGAVRPIKEASWRERISRIAPTSRSVSRRTDVAGQEPRVSPDDPLRADLGPQRASQEGARQPAIASCNLAR